MGNIEYALGGTPQELKRLMLQASIVRPITDRLLREAGLREGMRVLDLGCGPGDVCELVAEIVGPTGFVLGIDRLSETVAAARERYRKAGRTNIEFQASSVEAFETREPFDAAVGRLVLMHQPDPAAFIRAAVRHLRPGGIVAFHEMSFQHGFHSRPPVRIWDKEGEWLSAALRIDEPGRDAAGRFVEHFATAGLTSPHLFAEMAVGGGANSPLYAWVAESVRTLAAEIVARGIATEEEISIETLEERLKSSAMDAFAHGRRYELLTSG
jgi:SAM-dependent methyltransferase